jgi:hypothetical protein
VCDVLSGPKLDFGSQFVGRGWQLEVVMVNMGRRAASLAWSNTKLEELLKTYSKKARGTGSCYFGCCVLNSSGIYSWCHQEDTILLSIFF